MPSAEHPDLQRFISAIATQLRARAIPFMIIGGQAVLVHGEPRLTQDVDVTLARDPSGLPELLAACDALGLRPLPDDIADFTRRPRDLEDAAGVVRRKGEELDWDYIAAWAAQFASVPGRERIREMVTALRHTGEA